MFVVWIGATIYAHQAYEWGWPHAALAAIFPTIPVGAGIIIAVGVLVTPFALLWVGVQAVRDRLAR